MTITTEDFDRAGIQINSTKLRAMIVFADLLKNNGDGFTSNEFAAKALEAGLTAADIKKYAKLMFVHFRARHFIKKTDTFRRSTRGGRSNPLPVWVLDKAFKELTLADYV